MIDITRNGYRIKQKTPISVGATFDVIQVEGGLRLGGFDLVQTTGGWAAFAHAGSERSEEVFRVAESFRAEVSDGALSPE